ncbi:Arylsulfatase precursor [Pirellulimonas nuda]|uniref:Arylsulfatase n=1 Tax=Pirellulimonas nuda TaxID=2528009 RepID=A0A518DIB7_9BACT|nr:arylsulfatase [Pirellulimonas nuda]QDU91233.1 Arylsulfatase precursor [Pirellulimonas nuda]
MPRIYTPLVCCCLLLMAAASSAEQPPNIVFIMADDLGYGDLGCYGQQRIATPHLDRMAADGVRFSQHYAGSTVCAPSRCVLMTGKHLGHAEVRGNRSVSDTSEQPLEDATLTIAEVLKGRGYATAIVGKWGLGDQHTSGFPNKQGFDYSFGYLGHWHAHNQYPEFLFRNGEKVYLNNFVPGARPSGAGNATKREDYAGDLMIEEAREWINQNHSKPFFLYLSLAVPHANNEAGDEGMQVPDYGPYKNRDWPQPQKGAAAAITRMDSAIGGLLEQLETLGVADNTLVVFTSDNGPHAEGGFDPEFFHSSGPLRGIKRDLYEGGVRVPMMAVWPAKIEPGSESDTISGFQDWMATFADVAGADAPKETDGVSLVPSLTGKGQQQQHPYLYFEFYEQGGKRSVRVGPWKAVQLGMNSKKPRPVELYNLDDDLGERNNVAADHPEIVARLTREMDGARSDSPAYTFGAAADAEAATVGPEGR